MSTDSEPQNESDPTVGLTGYRVLAGISAAAGALVARALLKAGWRKVIGKAPPKSPQNPDVEWIEAVTWAAASAAVVAVARVAAERRVAASWKRASGTRITPPEAVTQD